MDELALAFARHSWAERESTLLPNRYLGVPCRQIPNDAWVIQEVIQETRPEVIIECGAFQGGSALMWANLMEQVGTDGRVVAIDVVHDPSEIAAAHPLWERVHWIKGSTVAPEVVEEALGIARGRRTMILLDSDHRKPHVLAELAAYADAVTPGCYLVVQDGLVSTIMPEYGPGPAEALEEFLPDPRFEVDLARDRMLVTSSPRGYLRRL